MSDTTRGRSLASEYGGGGGEAVSQLIGFKMKNEVRKWS